MVAFVALTLLYAHLRKISLLQYFSKMSEIIN